MSTSKENLWTLPVQSSLTNSKFYTGSITQGKGWGWLYKNQGNQVLHQSLRNLNDDTRRASTIFLRLPHVGCSTLNAGKMLNSTVVLGLGEELFSRVVSCGWRNVWSLELPKGAKTWAVKQNNNQILLIIWPLLFFNFFLWSLFLWIYLHRWTSHTANSMLY